MQLTYRFSELHLCHHTDNYFIPFQVLTKFRSISSGDLVTYSEVLKLNLSEFIYNEELKKAGLKATTPRIKIMEVEYFVKNGEYKENDTDYIQEKFNENYFNKFNYHIKVCKISSSFF